MNNYLHRFFDFLTEKMIIIAPWIVNILFTLFAPLFLFLTVFAFTCFFAMIGLFILYILTRPFVFIGRLLHISIPDEVQDKIAWHIAWVAIRVCHRWRGLFCPPH